MNIEWTWIPNICLGPIKIGSDIEPYLATLNLVADNSEDNTGWDTYIFPDFETYIDVEDEKVVSVTTYSEFLYKGQNLIGLNLFKLGELLGVAADEIGQPVEYEDGDIKTPYEYYELGLQVWVSDKHVTSISCTTYK